jgi:hypothetical protein
LGWLSEWRARARQRRADLAPGEGISLHVEEAINLGRAGDLDALLHAIEALPDDAVLYVEGTSIAPDIEEFLRAHAIQSTTIITRGTAWPRSTTLHVRLDPGLVARLRELAERHAGPEICDHLVVYRDDDVLLSAYDAGSETVWVRRDLPAEVVARLRDRLLGAG